MDAAISHKKKRLLSGIKPTGMPHIGNYFGAIRQCVDLQDDYECLYMIADLHALIGIHNRDAMHAYTIDMARAYLALGLDPERSIIFKQSDVAAHAELGWVFNCITTMPYLMRAHAFKDAEAKNKDINVGVFDYPILMAADILLYDTDVVPVGQDQKQHLEIARDTADRFNHVFGTTFIQPEPLILEHVAVVPGNDGRKMSKSYGNTLPLFAGRDQIEDFVMSITTDSKGINEPKDPEQDTVFAFHKLFSGDRLAEIREGYEKGGLGYGESKKILIETTERFIAPLRERYHALEHDKRSIDAVLAQGAERARAIASTKMREVKDRIGVSLIN